jgi:hypothetical protein
MSNSFTAHIQPPPDETSTDTNALGYDARVLGDGQRHDRISVEKQNTEAMSRSADKLNITTGQRMVSATWGSVLTSLLGEYRLQTWF